MAAEMWWVKAPFLTFVQLHALCFSSAASKKAGSAKDSRGKALFPSESRIVPDTTPQCISLAEPKNAAVGVVRSQRKLSPDLLGVCVNPVFYLLLRVCSLTLSF